MNHRRHYVATLVLGVFFAVFALSAAQAGASGPYRIKSDIAYGPASGRPATSRLDVYVPNEKAAEPRPVVVWIHGGGWFKGDKANSTMPGKAKAFVDAGFVVVSANYRLSPDLNGPEYLSRNRVRFPAAHLDVAQAVGWVNRHIERFGGDPGRILLGGESAGAQIAALLATRSGFLQAQGVSAGQIKGVISIDAVGFNVPRMMTSKYRRRNAGFQRMMFNAFGTPAEEKRKPRWSAASPVRYADPTDPPIYFVESAKAYDRQLDAFRMAVKLEQRLLVVWRVVPLSHRDGIGALLGNAGNDRGVTRRVIRFATEAVNPVVPQIVARGKRVVRANGAPTATVRLELDVKPRVRQLFCTMDKHLTELCPPSWKLAPGLHDVHVEAFGNTGRLVGEKTFKVEVKK